MSWPLDNLDVNVVVVNDDPIKVTETKGPRNSIRHFAITTTVAQTPFVLTVPVNVNWEILAITIVSDIGSTFGQRSIQCLILNETGRNVSFTCGGIVNRRQEAVLVLMPGIGCSDTPYVNVSPPTGLVSMRPCPRFIGPNYQIQTIFQGFAAGDPVAIDVSYYEFPGN